MLPWSNKSNTDILPPCKLCRQESIAVGNGLCQDCMDNKVLRMIHPQSS